MIYTITLNPAIDYVLEFDNLKINETNRAIDSYMYAAGKGIHVSRLLSNIGAKNIALYISSDDNGGWFDNDCKKQKIKTIPFMGKGKIRTNLKLIDNTSQTECNASSLIATKNTIKKINDFIIKNITNKDWVIISGSKPNNFTNNDFVSLCNKISKQTKNMVIDNSDPKLTLEIAKSNPLFIKPNKTEMENLCKYVSSKYKIKNKNEIYNKIISLGIQNIIVSQGEKGSLLITKDKLLEIPLNKKYEINNLAGSGDSMVAGIVYKLNKGDNLINAIKFGNVCGTATACSKRIALKSKIKKIIKEEGYGKF